MSRKGRLNTWFENNIDYFLQSVISMISTLVFVIPRHINGDLKEVSPIWILYLFVFLIFLGTFHIMFKAFDILDILLDKPIDKLLNTVLKALEKKIDKLNDEQEALREAKRKGNGVKRPPLTPKPNIKPTARPRK